MGRSRTFLGNKDKDQISSGEEGVRGSMGGEAQNDGGFLQNFHY